MVRGCCYEHNLFSMPLTLLKKKNPRVILLDPAGKQFDQAYAEDLAKEEELIFICGHYEGYDERIKTLVTDEISLGGLCLDWWGNWRP